MSHISIYDFTPPAQDFSLQNRSYSPCLMCL